MIQNVGWKAKQKSRRITVLLPWSSQLQQFHNFYHQYKFILLFIYNGNWTEWSALWAESYAWFQNRTSVQREFDLKSHVWFRSKIALHEVQLPLYYIHFEIAQIQDLVSSNTLLMQYWANFKLNPSIWGGGGTRVLETKVANEIRRSSQLRTLLKRVVENRTFQLS